MADTRDTFISDTLRQYGQPYASSVWKVQGKPVIYHKTLEQIAAQAGITWDMPQVVRAADNEAVILVSGRMGDRLEWSIGEARVKLGEGTWGNYLVKGAQPGYPWAMAEKRAKDRVILKLIGLAGFIYSEEEADDFKHSNQDAPKPAEQEGKVQSTADKICANIAQKKTWEEVSEFMTSEQVQARFAEMNEDDVARCRWEGAEAMKALGWVKGATAKAPTAAAPAGDASSRKEAPAGTGPVVDPDPYAKSNLATLANSLGSKVFHAKTPDEVEAACEEILNERKLDWDRLPQDIQDKINQVCDARIKALSEPPKGGRKK